MQDNSKRVKAIKKMKENTYQTHHLDRLAKPYFIWLLIFAVLPMLILFVLMFLDTEGLKLAGCHFTFSNFSSLLEKSIIMAFLNSLKYSLLTTVICLFFGYLIAYYLHRSHFKNKYLILLLLVLPMWTNILLRIEALSNMFQAHNIITNMLGITGFNILGTDLAIILGMVFTYLPFVILPIYTSLEKIDPSLEEAALDLGMTDFKKFWTVIFPLTTSGMVSGAIMVLLPCLSGFAIPKILGAGNILLIGNIIEQDFSSMSYNIGSILAVVMLVIILGAITIVNKFDKEGETLL